MNTLALDSSWMPVSHPPVPIAPLPVVPLGTHVVTVSAGNVAREPVLPEGLAELVLEWCALGEAAS